MEDGAKIFEADGGCGGFIVVDAVPLSEAFCDIPTLVSYYFACVIPGPRVRNRGHGKVDGREEFRSGGRGRRP